MTLFETGEKQAIQNNSEGQQDHMIFALLLFKISALQKCLKFVQR